MKKYYTVYGYIKVAKSVEAEDEDDATDQFVNTELDDFDDYDIYVKEIEREDV